MNEQHRLPLSAAAIGDLERINNDVISWLDHRIFHGLNKLEAIFKHTRRDGLFGSLIFLITDGRGKKKKRKVISRQNIMKNHISHPYYPPQGNKFSSHSKESSPFKNKRYML